MSETPELHPIADAFAKADAEAAAEAKRLRDDQDRRDAEAQERVENEAFFRDCYRRNGAALAKKFGRSVGFDTDMMDRLIVLEDEAIAGKADKVKAKKKRKDQPADDDAPADPPPAPTTPRARPHRPRAAGTARRTPRRPRPASRTPPRSP